MHRIVRIDGQCKPVADVNTQVPCTDKTGTLTSAEITLARSLDPFGTDDPRAARLGAIAADLGGDRGSLDAALLRGSAGGGGGLDTRRPARLRFLSSVGIGLSDGTGRPVVDRQGRPRGGAQALHKMPAWQRRAGDG